ncbi:MAG TPA: hypothetical protein VFU47_01815 [Armatimonadota bacterium]|nr:hypothetical protein [Armatimonadota bacterium]
MDNVIWGETPDGTPFGIETVETPENVVPVTLNGVEFLLEVTD